MKRNIHKIDDWLIRAGYLAVAGTLMASACTGGLDASTPNLAAQGGLAVGGLILLVVGYAVRRDDRRIVQVWRILEHSTEANVEELVHATGFSRPFLLRAVRAINRQPSVYYVWDDKAGTIIDGRMRSRMLAVERCESCGASINAMISLDLAVPPSCDHCGGPVTARDLNALKQSNLEAIRAQTLRPAHSFSVLLFLVLLLVFWPVALVYALWTTGLFDELLGRAKA